MLLLIDPRLYNSYLNNIYMYIYIYVCVCVYVCVCLSVSVSVSVCLCADPNACRMVVSICTVPTTCEVMAYMHRVERVGLYDWIPPWILSMLGVYGVCACFI